jgi:hypothetical protein
MSDTASLLCRFVQHGVPIQVLDINGLLKTKTDDREKDLIDKQALLRLRNQL